MVDDVLLLNVVNVDEGKETKAVDDFATSIA